MCTDFQIKSILSCKLPRFKLENYQTPCSTKLVYFWVNSVLVRLFSWSVHWISNQINFISQTHIIQTQYKSYKLIAVQKVNQVSCQVMQVKCHVRSGVMQSHASQVLWQVKCHVRSSVMQSHTSQVSCNSKVTAGCGSWQVKCHPNHMLWQSQVPTALSQHLPWFL